jgi:hypothetical protein
MTDPVLAGPGGGQDGSPAGLPSPLDSVADMRATAKWTIGALAAVGAALLGGAPLSAVGKIHGLGSASAAFGGLVIALAGIGWAIWHTTDALMPISTTLAAIGQPGLASLRDQIRADPAAFFGPFGSSVKELEQRSILWQTVAANAAIRLAAEPDEIRRRQLAQGIADAQANAANASARLRWLLEFAHAWRVRDQLRRARVHAFAGAVVAALGAVLFIAATTLPR